MLKKLWEKLCWAVLGHTVETALNSIWIEARLNGPDGPQFFSVNLKTILSWESLGVPFVIEAHNPDRLYLQVRTITNGSGRNSGSRKDSARHSA